MSSTRSKGNRVENFVAAHLEGLNYFCYPSRGSRGIDLICLAPPDSNLPHLGIEVGTEAKSVRAAFAKMRAATQFPGMIMLVARRIVIRRKSKIRWHADSGRWGTDSFMEAIEKARAL
jgi:hypothetical protein